MKIEFDNLLPSSQVTLHTTLTSAGQNVNFSSICSFKVPHDGKLDLTQQRCEGPSYTGVHPMGIFWSMEPGNGSLTRIYSCAPLHYSLELYDTSRGQKLFSTSFVRNICDPKISRLDVHQNGIVGSLFVPHGSGPFPAVTVIEGASVLKEDLAASIAGKGFVVLVLAFFR